MLLDEKLQAVPEDSINKETMGYQQVGEAGALTPLLKDEWLVTKSGYVYIYTSNESAGTDVFFDNMLVTTISGPLLETNHTYPFGLTMKGISAQAAGALGNKYQFNGKEKQEKEWGDGSGLELYDMYARQYDQQIGRWHVADPLADDPEQINKSLYAFVWNNPANLIDPTGLKPFTDFVDIFSGAITHIEDGKDQVIAADKNIISSLIKLFDKDINEYNSRLKSLEKSRLNLNMSRSQFDLLAETVYAESTGGFFESVGIVTVLENRAANEGNSIMDQLKVESPYGVYGVWKTSNGKHSDYKYSYKNEKGAAADKKRLNIHQAIATALLTNYDITNGAYFWDGSDIKTNKHYTAWGVTFTNPGHNLWNQKNTTGSNQLNTTAAHGSTIFTKFQNQGKKWYISK